MYCKYGAVSENRWFMTATKKINDKIITINYENGEHGCRSTESANREKSCLENNFSEFESNF